MKDISVRGLGGTPEERPILAGNDTNPQPEAVTVSFTTPAAPQAPDDTNPAQSVAGDMGATFSNPQPDADPARVDGNEYDEQGRIIKEIKIDENGNPTGGYRLFKYDDNGNVSEKINVDQNGQEITRRVYEYDEAGNKVGDKLYEAGQLFSETTYLEQGRKRETIFYKDDGSVDFKTAGEYDDQGRDIKTTFFDADGNMTQYGTCEYDDAGRVILDTVYDEKGNLSRKTENTYNAEGGLVKQVVYNGSDKTTSTITYNGDMRHPNKEVITNARGRQMSVTTFNYDADGREARRVERDDDYVTTVTSRYDSQGRIHKETEYTRTQDRSWDQTLTTVHSYTPSGQKASVKTFGSDGNIAYGRVNKYDDDGHLIETRFLSQGGQPNEIVTYDPQTGKEVSRRELAVKYD